MHLITFFCLDRNLTLYSFPQESECTEHPKNASPPTEKSTNRSKARKSKVSVKCEIDENTPIAKLMKT